MKKIIPFSLGCIALISLLAAQHGTFASITNKENGVAGVQETAMGCAPASKSTQQSTTANGNFGISTFLSDEELSKFKFETFIFELGPGQTDTISHRHDCDVFVTILEGTALIGQEFKAPDTVKAGEIFHEKRNVIHSLTTNPSKDQRMKALIVSVRKDGRAFYTPLFPKK